MATWKQENIMLTKVGEQALANAEAGEGKITITKVIGSSFSSEDIYNVNSQTQISENITFSIVDKENLEDNVGTSIHIQAVNKNLTAKFRLNTVVVYATHNSIGSGAFPYMIAKAENADEINTPDITPTTLNYSLTIVNTRGGLLNITLNPAGLVPMSTFTRAKQALEEKIGNDINSHNLDKNAHINKFIESVKKNNLGISVTKGDNTESINLLTTDKEDINSTSVAPTLSLVNDLIGGMDITNLLKSKGVRYSLDTDTGWYICLGKSFGNLIIQGGTLSKVYSNGISNKAIFPISFSKSAKYVSVTAGGIATSNVYKHYMKVDKVTNESFYCYPDDTVVNIVYWIAIGV